MSWLLVWLQSKLVEQIGAMLSSFAQRRSEEVSRTMASLNSQLDSSRNAIGMSFAEISNLGTATTGHLQVSHSQRCLCIACLCQHIADEATVTVICTRMQERHSNMPQYCSLGA